MKKIKVVHVLASNKFSGAENVALTIMKNIKMVECIYVSPKGDIEKRLKQENIPYYGIPKLNYMELKKAIKILNPDIIHAHDFIASSLSSLVSNGKIPVISHLHNNPPFIKKYGIFSVLYYFTCKNYSKILTVSDSVMNEYVFGQKLISKTINVGNPFDAKEIRKKAENADLHDESDIIFLGRLTEQKNPFVFLNIINQLKEFLPNVKVNMVGSGELEFEVLNKIKELQLEHNVQLYGFQDNPYGLLKNSKVLCIPSKWEGFGLVAIEALSLAKPVIASNVGGLKNIINEDCGYICESENEFIVNLKTILKDLEIYSKKSEGALKRSLYYDNVDAYCDKLLYIYEKCLKDA